MKYLKFFESMYSQSNHINNIVNNLDRYLHEFDVEDYFWELMSTLRIPSLNYQYADDISKDEIRDSVDYIFKHKEEKNYDELLKLYTKIIQYISNTSKEEIEDLFLDFDKYAIHRRKNGFLVVISNIKNDDVPAVCNRIWNVIGKRLPKDHIVKDMNISNTEEKMNGLVEIEVKIFEI